MQLSVLLRRTQPGAKSGVQGHLKRTTRMQTLIAERLSVENAEHDRERGCVAAMEAADSGGGEGSSNRRKNTSAW